MNRILIFVLFSGMISCGIYETFDCYDGSKISKKIVTEQFHKIDIDFACEVLLQEGKELSITIEGKDDLIEDLEKFSKVQNDTWRVRIKKNCFVNNRKDTKLLITVPDLSKIFIDGNAKVTSETELKNTAKDFVCEVDGNADIDLNIAKLDKITIYIDGNAEAELTGEVDQMSAKIDGSAELFAHEYFVNSCEIEIDGIATANVNVSKSLNVVIDGSGVICYKGNPTLISKIDGIGKLKNCN